MALVLAFITGVVSILFAASLMDHYLVKRRQYHLLWAIAFAVSFLGMLFWVLREGLGQSEFLYSLFTTAGVLIPAYFGSGMISMMFPQLLEGTIGGTEGGIKKADAFLGAIVGISVIFLILAMVAPIKTPTGCLFEGLDCLLPSHTLTTDEFLPSWLRIIGTIIAVYGGLAVLAGAVWAVVQLVRQEKEASGEASSPTMTDEGIPTEPNVLVGGLNNTVLGFKLLWQNKDFWNRDLPAQRSYSNLIVLVGMVLGALGATMNSVEGSSTHVLLFLLAGIAVYVGFLANKEVMETTPASQLRESFVAAKSLRGAPAATLAPEAGYVAAEAPVAEAPPETEPFEAAAPEEVPTAEEPEAAPREVETPEAQDPEEAPQQEPTGEEERPSAIVEPLPEPEEEGASPETEADEQAQDTEEPASDTEEETRPS